MRFAAGLLLLLLVSGLSGQDLSALRLTEDFTGRPLSEAINHLEKQFDLNFSFPTEVIRNSTVNCSFREAGWEEIEQCLFGANELRATVLRDGYVTLKPLPAGTERSWALRFRVLSPEGAALAFAPVQLPDGPATTDADGTFTGKTTAAASDMIYLTYLGHESRGIAVRDLIAGSPGLVTLASSAIDLSSVLVSEYLADGISIPESGSFVRVKPERAPSVPGFADGEVYRTLSLLPGIANTDETAGGLSIRGGSPDQNLVLWDGIPVYSAGHYFAMISPFSPELIEEINVWRGNSAAAYGGRVGGLVEINTDRKVATETSAGAGLSLLAADAFLKLPVVVGKADVQLAFRTAPPVFSTGPAYSAYREQVFQGDVFARILQAEERGLPREEDFNFREFNGRAQFNFGPKHALSVSGFTQHDDFGYRIGRQNSDRFFIDGLVTKNDGISGDYARPLGEGRLRLQVALSAFSEAGGSGFQNARLGVSVQRGSELRENSVRVEYGVVTQNGNAIEFGLQLQKFSHELEYVSENTLADSLGEFSFSEGRAGAAAAYGSYKWGGNGPLTLETGLRLQYYGPAGKLYPEPRINLSYRLAEDWRLKAAYGESHQFTQEVVNLNPQRISAMGSLWTLADDQRLPVATGREGSLGLSGEAGDWLFDAEVYHKEISGITTLNSLLLREGLARGSSRATGLDLLVKRRWANWRSWAIYTLSRTEWQFPEFGPGYFPADNDRRHQLQLVHSYSNKGWSASVGWRIHSGVRFTESRGVETMFRPRLNRGIPQLVTGPTNGGRLPAFHRLDVSVFRDISLPSKRWYGRVGLSILNVYNRENFLERRYLIGDTEVPGRDRFFDEEIDRLGLGFTPNLSLRVGWR